MPGKHQNRLSTRDLNRSFGQHLTHFERTRIWSLFFDAGWNKRQIGRYMGLGSSTIRSFLKNATTTPVKQQGRKPNLTTQKRKRLITRATQDAFHRHMPYEEIAFLEGISACRHNYL